MIECPLSLLIKNLISNQTKNVLRHNTTAKLPLLHCSVWNTKPVGKILAIHTRLFSDHFKSISHLTALRFFAFASRALYSSSLKLQNALCIISTCFQIGLIPSTLLSLFKSICFTHILLTIIICICKRHMLISYIFFAYISLCLSQRR